MDSEKCSTKAVALATGLIIAGVALATLTTGCDNGSAEQATALVAGAPNGAADQPGDASNLDLLSKIAGNHNETFLIIATD